MPNEKISVEFVYQLLEKGEKQAALEKFQTASDHLAQAIYFLGKLDIAPEQKQKIKHLMESQKKNYDKAAEEQAEKENLEMNTYSIH